MSDYAFEVPTDEINELIARHKYEKYRNQFLLMGGIIMFLQFATFGIIGGMCAYTVGQYQTIKSESTNIFQEVSNDIGMVKPFVNKMYSFVNETKEDIDYFKKLLHLNRQNFKSKLDKRTLNRKNDWYISESLAENDHDAYCSSSTSVIPSDLKGFGFNIEDGAISSYLSDIPETTTESDSEHQ